MRVVGAAAAAAAAAAEVGGCNKPSGGFSVRDILDLPTPPTADQGTGVGAGKLRSSSRHSHHTGKSLNP